MYVELMTGKDNFRAQQSSPKRHVEVNLYVCTPDMKKFTLIYLALKGLAPGLGAASTVSAVPATSRFTEDLGKWFKTRYEVVPNTLFLVEYRRADRTSAFAFTTSYML